MSHLKYYNIIDCKYNHVALQNYPNISYLKNVAYCGLGKRAVPFYLFIYFWLRLGWEGTRNGYVYKFFCFLGRGFQGSKSNLDSGLMYSIGYLVFGDS